jgi:hypothetical protein
MDKVIHSSRNNLRPVLKFELEICLRHLAFTHIVLRLNEASAKHLQDTPVKVADRYDTGCADANLTGSLLI